MTPFELELLKTAWPWVWAALLGGAGFYLKALNRQIGSIVDSMKQFREDVVRIEKEIAADRMENRHRIDRLIGDSDTRLSRIEAVCETQHGLNFNRRAGDPKPVHWARDSDVSGNTIRETAR